MARDYFTTRRVLVTGGAGFVGAHLIDRLIDRGDEVLCVDNLFTGAKANISHLLGHPRFEFWRHDIYFRFLSKWMQYSIWRAQRRRSITSMTRSKRLKFR
jgi:nucleoside-diphosphate-sugar epimerase